MLCNSIIDDDDFAIKIKRRRSLSYFDLIVDVSPFCVYFAMVKDITHESHDSGMRIRSCVIKVSFNHQFSDCSFNYHTEQY